MKKRKFSVKVFVCLFLLLIHFSSFYILITVSFKKQMDLTSRWKIPSYLYLDNFYLALTKGGIIQAVGNTLLITVVSVFLIVMLGSMAAYPLARVHNKVNSITLSIILSVMMIPPLSVLVPLYKTLISIHGINTYWGIILVSVTYNLPISIFLFSNFIITIPKALDEAAMIDGCSRISAFYKVVIPSLKPVTASVIILTGVYIWNDYSFQLYILQKKNMRTVTLAIASFFTENASNLNAGAAAALLVILPPIFLYLTMQKYFVQGITEGAVKE